ncbi:WD40 repeat domain-containing protein [Pelolinea submarina]|uniref:WD40 repeat protein n=1 Tax=Pelolinea submarina TaxID=913107 RepID=A0A347ZUA9_9CHLR|nr:WD40 repeat domain-containing protein [Pelolinea submarina]REG10525.1 WD40 repeat protein [Pelolinea submarina]BBB48890.1 hypothetical protein Pelsub_P2121 [Pelolinea submarina]
MNEKNNQLIENPTSNNALVSLHSFEAETRLACLPEHKLKPIIGYRTDSYHPIDENYKLIVSPNDEIIAEQCGKAIYLMRRNTLKVFQVISLEGIRTSFVFTPDSKKLIVADSKGKVSIWEIESGVCQNVIDTKRESVKKIHISKDGRTLLLDARTLVELYKINTGECIGSYESKADLLGFGPDDQTFVRTDSHSIEVIDIHDGKLLRTYDFSYIAEAVLSPGNNQILVVDAIGKKKILDLKTGHSWEIQIISRFSSGSMAIHSSGRYIILCSQQHENYLELWDLENDSKIDIPGKWENVQICQNERTFFAKEANMGKFSFWNIKNGEKLFEINPDGNLNVVEPEISNGHGLLITSGYKEGATLWNLKTGHDKHHFTEYSRQVFNAYFSQNGKFLLTDNLPDRINLWETETGECLRRWKKFPYQLRLAFAPDNHLLAYIVGGKIIIENVFYEDEELRLPVGNDQEKMIKFSDDNHFLYHFSINPPENCFTYTIYQARTGELIEKYRHESDINNDTKYDIDFARAHLYTIDGGRIIQTDLITGKIIQTFRGPVEDFDRFLITSMAFDPNGKWLAGAYQKSHVAFWEMAGDGKPQLIVDTTTMNPNGIQNLCFMKEEVLMICSVDGVINFWDIARKSLLAKLYCVKEGYLWTTPPDEFAPNGWLHTNRTDLISLTSAAEDGKVIEYISEEDPRCKDYLQIYNDQEMVMTRLNDYERYQELLKNRIQMKDQTEHKLLEKSRNDAQNLLLSAGKMQKSI